MFGYMINFMRKNKRMKLLGLITLMWISCSLANTAFAETATEFLKSPSTWWELNDAGELTNLSAFKKQSSSSLNSGSLEVQITRSDTLELIGTTSQGDVRYLLNGNQEIVSNRSTSPAVLTNGAFWVMTEGNRGNQLTRVSNDQEELFSINPQSTATITSLEHGGVENPSLVAWVEAENESSQIKLCNATEGNCETKTLITKSSTNIIREIVLSKGVIAWTEQDTEGSSINVCELSNPSTLNNNTDGSLCTNKRSYKSSRAIKQLSMDYPSISWSEKVQGVYEIMAGRIQEQQLSHQQITSKSHGDQLNSSIIISGSNTEMISWESYSSGVSRIQLAGLRVNRPIERIAFDEKGEKPLLITTNTTGDCTAGYELNFVQGNSIQSWNRSQESKSWNTKPQNFSQAREGFEISVSGTNTNELRLSWRTHPSQRWQVANPSDEGKWQVQAASKSIELNLESNMQITTCISDIQIVQQGTVLEDINDEEIVSIDIDIEAEPQVTGILTETRLTKPATNISEETLLALQNLKGNQQTSVQILNIFEKASLSRLNLVTGTGKDLLKPIWIYLINDRRQSIILGSQSLKSDRSFRVANDETPESFKGEVLIVASHIPDIRLVSGFADQTAVVSAYIFTESDISEGQEIIDLAVELESLSFFQGSQELQQYQQDQLTVVLENEEEPVRLQVSGRIFGEGLETVDLIAEYNNEQERNSGKIQENGSFIIDQQRIDHKILNNKQEVILYALDEDQQLSSSQVISFKLIPNSSAPSWFAVIKDDILLNLNMMICIGLLIIFILFAYSSSFQALNSTKRTAQVLVLIQLLIVMSMTTKTIVTKGYETGLLSLPSLTSQEHYWTLPKKTDQTLTKLNNNLQVVPNLAKSWSNINPYIWEFNMRKDNAAALSSSQTVLQSIKQIILEEHPAQQYLSTLEQVTLLTGDRIQFITKTPDPLIPQKLSRVPLQLSNDLSRAAKNLEEYTLIEDYSYSRRWKRNPDFRDQQFSNAPFIYKDQIAMPNEEAMISSLESSSLDTYHDAKPETWELMKESNYKMVPSVSTESVVLLTNRESFYLQDKAMIEYLSLLLSTDELLQGDNERHLNQFAPPGVLGFDPELKQSSSNNSEAKNPINREEVTLTLHFPTRERNTARRIESILQKNKMTIIPKEYPSAEFEQLLLDDLSDLVLIPLEFPLGDVGSLYDTLIHSESPFNHSYQNEEVDQLITQAREELDTFERSEILKKVMRIITKDDPAGIPVLYRTKADAKKTQEQKTWYQQFMAWVILNWS